MSKTVKLTKEDLVAVLASRLYHAVDNFSQENAERVAEFLIESETVTSDTLFSGVKQTKATGRKPK